MSVLPSLFKARTGPDNRVRQRAKLKRQIKERGRGKIIVLIISRSVRKISFTEITEPRLEEQKLAVSDAG